MNQLQLAREQLRETERAIESLGEEMRAIHLQTTMLRDRAEKLKRFVELGESLFVPGREGTVSLPSPPIGPMARMLAEHDDRTRGLAPRGLAGPVEGALAQVTRSRGIGLPVPQEAQQATMGLAAGLAAGLPPVRASGLGLSDPRPLRVRSRRVADAAFEIIRTLGPQPTRELLSLLKDRGLEPSGSDPQAALSVLLSRDDRFESDRGRGGWSVAGGDVKGPSGAGTPDGASEK